MPPSGSKTGESDLVSARLAEVLTVVSSVAVLSEVSGSNTPEVVLAVLEMFVVREDSTFTTSFFFNDTATTEIYTLSLHDALPILPPPVAETKLVPAGIASDRLTP